MTHPTAVLALGIALAACAQPAVTSGEAVQAPTIAVAGIGEVTGVPDTLVIDLGVAVVRPNVTEAAAEASRLAGAVIAALEANGVAESDIQTTGYSIWPEYDYRADIPTITGYRVSHTVSAKIRGLDMAGDTIDAAVAAGGNDTIVNTVRFDLEADSELVTAARQAAWTDARARADQLASLAGVTLGPVVSVAETLRPGQSTPYGIDADEGGMPVMPGEETVSVVIEVSFEIAS